MRKLILFAVTAVCALVAFSSCGIAGSAASAAASAATQTVIEDSQIGNVIAGLAPKVAAYSALVNKVKSGDKAATAQAATALSEITGITTGLNRVKSKMNKSQLAQYMEILSELSIARAAIKNAITD